MRLQLRAITVTPVMHAHGARFARGTYFSRGVEDFGQGLSGRTTRKSFENPPPLSDVDAASRPIKSRLRKRFRTVAPRLRENLRRSIESGKRIRTSCTSRRTD